MTFFEWAIASRPQPRLTTSNHAGRIDLLVFGLSGRGEKIRLQAQRMRLVPGEQLALDRRKIIDRKMHA